MFTSASRGFLRAKVAARSYSKNKSSSGTPFAFLALAAAAAAATTTAQVAHASDDAMHVQPLKWYQHGMFNSFDAAAIRRGHQVYTQVCAACHSLDLVAYRTLINVAFTEQEVKFMTSEIDIEDGPDNTGEMFDRPGKPYDYFKNPYKNKQEGRMANSGAFPPDLSMITKARHGNEDYIFFLLTGYRDPPAGVEISEGLNYNPYFTGGTISMAKQLQNGGVDYEDGTPATETQMAKDVTTFLAWAASPEQDERKRVGLKWSIVLVAAVLLSGYYKRHTFAIFKARKISYV